MNNEKAMWISQGNFFQLEGTAGAKALRVLSVLQEGGKWERPDDGGGKTEERQRGSGGQTWECL